MYLPVSSFTCQPPDQSPPNFVQTFTPNQGKFLTQVWPRLPNPLTLGYPKLQNLSRSTLEKKLCFTKNVHKGDLFFTGSAGPWFASISIYYTHECYHEQINFLVFVRKEFNETTLSISSILCLTVLVDSNQGKFFRFFPTKKVIWMKSIHFSYLYIQQKTLG